MADVTSWDQLRVFISFISNESLPVERFLGFIPFVGYKRSDIEQGLLKKCSEVTIDFKYWFVGQSYVNVFNIVYGIYNGLQTRIKNYSSNLFCDMFSTFFEFNWFQCCRY